MISESVALEFDRLLPDHFNTASDFGRSTQRYQFTLESTQLNLISFGPCAMFPSKDRATQELPCLLRYQPRTDAIRRFHPERSSARRLQYSENRAVK
jgi:hypothetical protein